MGTELKLFVWEEFYGGYFPGMAVAIAETREKAINQIREKVNAIDCKDYKYYLETDNKTIIDRLEKDLTIYPLDKPMADFSPGGD